MHYDAIVIGAGQAGSPLARRLSEAGQRTLLVERAHVGGTCINVGCTPTKTMVASARAAHVARPRTRTRPRRSRGCSATRGSSSGCRPRRAPWFVARACSGSSSTTPRRSRAPTCSSRSAGPRTPPSSVAKRPASSSTGGGSSGSTTATGRPPGRLRRRRRHGRPPVHPHVVGRSPDPLRYPARRRGARSQRAARPLQRLHRPPGGAGRPLGARGQGARDRLQAGDDAVRGDRPGDRGRRDGGHDEVLLDPSTEFVLGAANVGIEAGELIHIFVALMRAGASARVFVDAEAINPTPAEGVQSLVMALPRYRPA